MSLLEVGLVQYIAQELPDYTPKIYPTAPPGNSTTPHVTYLLVSKPGDPVLAGPCSLQETRYQFDYWASFDTEGLKVARTWADQFRTVLDGFSGELPNGVCVRAIWFDDERTFIERDTRLHNIQQDYLIWYYTNS